MMQENKLRLTFLHQVERTATAVDRGHSGLVLLAIDETDLPLIVEDCYELGEEYPHIYGPIPVGAVTAVMPFPPSADGSFTISDVPVGTYVLHAWHERANNPVSQQVEVTGNVSGELALQLDAREYEFVQHLNKFGRPYSMARRGRRY